MTTFPFAINRASPVPLHRQIGDALRQAVLEGRLRPGQRIPSTRSLAEDLGVSRLPVLTAYEQLLHEGYLEGRTGSGTYVSDELPDHHLGSTRPARAGRRRLPVPARADAGLGPFRMSLPALDQFPHAAWARLVARHAHALRHVHMAYGDPAGAGPLRAAIAEYLRAARAVKCEADQLLVVSGSQEALRIASSVLLQPGDRIAVEEPGYPGARAGLGAGGAELIGIPVDGEGMSLASLERRSRIRAVCVTPSHQYPLGVSMSAARRIALLDWAERTGAWVLEDDYDSEYRYVSRPLGALQGMDRHERVIYIGTFSKVLFPALRIGYLVVPTALWPRFIETREAIDLFSPTLYQLVLAEFLADGHFARHVRRMRGVYLARRNALLAGLARHCGGRITGVNADAGLHASALLTHGMDDRKIIRRMAARGLTASALSRCYAGTEWKSGLLLGFGGSTERRLLDSTRILGQVLTA